MPRWSRRKRFSSTLFSAVNASASLVAISSWSAHNSSVDIDLKSFRFMMVPNHDSKFEPSSSADSLRITRPIQNALLDHVRWSRVSTEEICVVQRELDQEIFRIPITQSEIDLIVRPP